MSEQRQVKVDQQQVHLIQPTDIFPTYLIKK